MHGTLKARIASVGAGAVGEGHRSLDRVECHTTYSTIVVESELCAVMARLKIRDTERDCGFFVLRRNPQLI